MTHFAEQQWEQLLKVLERYLNNSEIGITRERYLEIIDQIGEEYDEDRAPPDVESFPYEVSISFHIYGKLPCIYAGMGAYVGKDLASLEVLMDVLEVEKMYRRAILDLIMWIDQKAIKKSSDETKRSSKKK